MEKKILFQGDSVTYCFRDQGNPYNMGHGYPTLVASELSVKYPLEYEFWNRGVGGDRLLDLYVRSRGEIINIAPDYLSILIGINDVWHEFTHKNGVSAEKYELFYDMLIEDVKTALPNIKIMILEPFMLLGPANRDTTTEPNKYITFRRELDLRVAAAKRVADKHAVKFVPLQKTFDDALKLAPANYWLYDGVHPTPAGHELIKQKWIEAFEQIK